MSLNELSNEQILFLFLSNKELYDSYGIVLENKKYQSSLNLLDMGNIVVTHLVNDEDIDEIKNSKHYNYVVEMHEKLEPIALMIEEANPKLYEKIYSIITERSFL